MRRQKRRVLCEFGAAVVAWQFFASHALAVSTMADWTSENTNAGNTTFTFVTTNNNYGLISNTSVGGDIQSKVNFAAEGFINNEEHHVYFSDPSLEGPTLDYTSPLHMEGTITFNSPMATEPNFCFCWYNSDDTRHRIGLGISNLTATQNPPDGAVANMLRIDFGYAADGGNKFYNVSADGTATQSPTNSVMPNGTYSFTFDYTPGPTGQSGGVMSATVGDFYQTIQPLETTPWDLDFFTFDRFGLVQRSTGSVTQNPTNTYNVVFSNVTYTGGSEFAPPAVEGDYNGNGIVDAADYTVWRDSVGAEALLNRDPNNVGTVGDDDYDAWVARFGNVTGSASSTAIPEPSSLILLALSVSGAIGGSVGRLRRKSPPADGWRE